ncbi:hypothetical protein PVA38_11880 [Streptococcus pneumoniae D39]|nr:hypothetical protein PVA38_11880 [Streptococcus pneumoniae D39]
MEEENHKKYKVYIRETSSYFVYNKENMDNNCFCLLYTSDAADEARSVDLGGRRNIKKKKKKKYDTAIPISV